MLDEVGLLSALSWYVDGLRKRSGVEISLDVRAAEFPEGSSAEVETAVFRIVQEALTNVFRHSEAQKVWITLTQTEGLIVVAVRDDGKGIGKRIVELQPDSVGVGIGGMKQRAKEFGAELRLTNVDPGTLVELSDSLFFRSARAKRCHGRCVGDERSFTPGVTNIRQNDRNQYLKNFVFRCYFQRLATEHLAAPVRHSYTCIPLPTLRCVNRTSGETREKLGLIRKGNSNKLLASSMEEEVGS